jgi:hypothetical protein
MAIKVRYLTEPDWGEKSGLVARTIEIEFESIEDAKAAAFPVDTVFAIIRVNGGYHSCIKGLAWEYHEGDILGARD